MAIITGSGPYQGPGGFDRGMQSTMYCGNDPESWVRASATLDTSSGAISLTIQLETDSDLAGPKGKATVSVRDADGATLATAVSDEIGMGGKPGGSAVIRNFSAPASIPAATAQRVASLWVEAQCAGSVGGPFGFNPDDLTHAFSIAVQLLGSSGGS